MYLSLARCVSEDEFLILDDEEDDSTQAKPESIKPSEDQSVSDNSTKIGSLSGAISGIQGMLGEGVSKIRSSISDAREKKVAKVESGEELVLDDGSLEKVIFRRGCRFNELDGSRISSRWSRAIRVANTRYGLSGLCNEGHPCSQSITRNN